MPVTTRRLAFLSVNPTTFMYVSIIQTMIWPLVPTSGAGMSYSGPMLAPRAWVNRRVIRSSSACECWRGMNLMPPFPPPNGMSCSAHLYVIHEASAFTSSSETCSWYRMPPLYGPRILLCWTR